MKKRIVLLACGLAVASLTLFAQDKPAAPPEPAKNSVIVVSPFTAAAEVSWPYDMKEMQRQTIGEMKTKLGTQFDIVAEAPVVAPAHLYTLNGEVVGWRAGNAAKRAFIGMGRGVKPPTSITGLPTGLARSSWIRRTPFAPNSGAAPLPDPSANSRIPLPTKSATASATQI